MASVQHKQPFVDMLQQRLVVAHQLSLRNDSVDHQRTLARMQACTCTQHQCHLSMPVMNAGTQQLTCTNVLRGTPVSYNSSIHSGVLHMLTATLHTQTHKRITLLQIHWLGRCATECRGQEGGKGMR
jgi:hypothetical protein